MSAAQKYIGAKMGKKTGYGSKGKGKVGGKKKGC